MNKKWKTEKITLAMYIDREFEGSVREIPTSDDLIKLGMELLAKQKVARKPVDVDNIKDLEFILEDDYDSWGDAGSLCLKATFKRLETDAELKRRKKEFEKQQKAKEAEEERERALYEKLKEKFEDSPLKGELDDIDEN